MDYIIRLTKAEDLALQYVAARPQEWIENSAKNRARIAIDEICQFYTNYKLEHNQPIMATNKSDIVLAAYNEGLIQKVSEKT